MKNIKKIAIFFTIFAHSFSYSIDNIVTFTFERYPMIKEKKELSTEEQAHISKKLQQPAYTYKKSTQLKTLINSGIQGIMVLYGGNVAISDENGQIIFPRKQQTDTMYCLITEKITPTHIIDPATINRWMIDHSVNNDFYEIKQAKDAETGLLYYMTKKIGLPKDNHIPVNTIIIITKPEYVYLPEGATVIAESSDITLPTIWVKKHFNYLFNNFATLEIKQYFAQNVKQIRQDNSTISEIIQQ